MSSSMACQIGNIVKKERDTSDGIFSCPSFFKVLIGDYSEKLRIPPLFARIYLQKFVGKSFKLETEKGLWPVVITRNGELNYFFKGGWAEFVQGNNLEFGDFLVFFLTSPSTLHVVMYNKTACAKNLVAIVETPISSLKQKRATSNMGNSAPATTNTTCFEQEVILKTSWKSCTMGLAKSFMRRSGLSQTRTAKISNSKGETWPVKVKNYGLGQGWSTFWRDNNLKAGDKYMLRCLCDSSRNHVEIIFHKIEEALELKANTE